MKYILMAVLLLGLVGCRTYKYNTIIRNGESIQGITFLPDPFGDHPDAHRYIITYTDGTYRLLTTDKNMRLKER